MKSTKVPVLEKISKQLALLTLDISYKAKVPHIGSSLSICDLITGIYFHSMNISKQKVNHPNRDRFILSKGHAAAVLYCALYKKGIIDRKTLDTFCIEGDGLCEHPEIHSTGIEMSTGSLGHGLPFAVGVALGLQKNKKSAHVYVLASDGELGEGSMWESALLASRLKLGNLTCVLDYNNWQCFGRANEITNLKPLEEKWKAFGWNVHTIDGHNMRQIVSALNKKNSSKPHIIIAHTIAGRGVPLIENKLSAHYKVLSEVEYNAARKSIET